jgi:ABC-type transport system substrate-binding protein
MIAAGLNLRAPPAAALLSLFCVIAGGTRAAAAPEPAVEAPQRAVPAPQRAVIGMQLEPPVLDPTVNPAAAIAEALYANLYEGLVKFAPDGSVRPSLAESWEISADGLTYVFHLRAGVRFHNGAVFDASTAKFSLDRALAPDAVNPQRSRIGAIRAVRVIDGRTLSLSLERRSGGLLQSLAWASFVMVEPRSAATDAMRPVGTGPFRFLFWRRGDSLTLEANPGYWGGPPQLGQATSMHSPITRRRRASRNSRQTGVSRCSSAARKARRFSRSTIAARRSTTSRSGARSLTPSIDTPSSTARCSATARRSAATFRRTAPTMWTSRTAILTMSRRRRLCWPKPGIPTAFR